jgi:very-short-patch-repair endonuclease
MGLRPGRILPMCHSTILRMVPLSVPERILITGPARSVKLARKLRSEMSLPEVLLWRELRKRPGGFKFRWQRPAGEYVLDFYCAAVRLAIEVDGAGHDGAEAEARHKARSNFLRSQHVATMRVPAEAVLKDVAAVVVRISEVCSERAERMAGEAGVPLHHATHGPPPRSGEDLAPNAPHTAAAR